MIAVPIQPGRGQFARVQPRLRAVVRDFAVYLALLLLFVVPASLLPGSAMLEVLGFSSLIAIVLYEPLTVAYGGGTIGHRTLNMRVVRAETLGRVGLPRALLRSLIKLIS